jgi:hypothetical protein
MSHRNANYLNSVMASRRVARAMSVPLNIKEFLNAKMLFSNQSHLFANFVYFHINRVDENYLHLEQILLDGNHNGGHVTCYTRRDM